MKQSIQEKTVSLLSSPKNRLLTVQTRHELRTSLPSRIQLYVDLDFSLIVWNYMEVLCVHCTGTCRTRRFLNMRVGYFDHWQGLDWWTLLVGTINEPWLPNEHRRYGGNDKGFLWGICRS